LARVSWWQIERPVEVDAANGVLYRRPIQGAAKLLIRVYTPAVEKEKNYEVL
jgi:hypothetical protein